MITRRRLFVLSSVRARAAFHRQRGARTAIAGLAKSGGAHHRAGGRGRTDGYGRARPRRAALAIWGHQVVVENKGGAGTNLANETVARSDPDGYTVLYATASLAVNRSLYRSLSYDALADLAPVSLVSRFPFFMFVPNSSPAKSVMEFIAYAKAHPGKLTLASPGTGSAPHLAGELFRQMAKIDLAHVPYRS